MKKVKIVSDSTCDLPEELIKEYNIGIIPINVIFNDIEVKQQYINITNEEFYKRLIENKEMPKTAIPAPKIVKEVLEKALKESDEVIVFCVTSKLSGMYSNAETVARQFFKEKVVVIDTQLLTLQMGLVVLEAAKKASSGATKKEILDYVHKILLPNVKIIGVLPTLKYLQKGGRIGKVKSLLGGLLQLKPFLCVENGELIPLGKARGLDNAYKILLDFCQLIAKQKIMDLVFVVHTNNYEKAEKLAQEFRKVPNAPKELMIMEIGPAIGTHIGPGVLGFVWVGDFNKKLIKF